MAYFQMRLGGLLCCLAIMSGSAGLCADLNTASQDKSENASVSQTQTGSATKNMTAHIHYINAFDTNAICPFVKRPKQIELSVILPDQPVHQCVIKKHKNALALNDDSDCM